MEKFGILLVTRGRIDKQTTLNNLSPLTRQLVTMVCHPGERKAHLKNWGYKIDSVVEYPEDCKNIGAIREWCMSHFEFENIIFLDDNLKFQVRREPDFGERTKFPLYLLDDRHFSEDTIETVLLDMFHWILKKLYSGYGIAGISPRTGNNRHENEEDENTRIFGAWGINVRKYKECKAKFSDHALKEDFYIQLAMLTKGIKTIISYNYAFDKVGGANSKGGCSSYRNIENSNQSAIDLQKAYPDFVRVSEKSAKNWGGDFKQTEKMLDVVISWKKAYEYGTR